MLFGAGPLFPFSDDPALPWWGMLACVGIGIATGLLSGVLTIAPVWLEDAFEHLPLHWMWWPALGGVVVGLGGLIEPRALGVGYDVIGDLLGGHMLARAVLVILVVKSVIWLVALSSGTSGGVLAPLLIFGGALGWLVGLGAARRARILGAARHGRDAGRHHAGAVDGRAVRGRADRRPADALPALFAATVSAYAVTVLLLKRSILTEKIARRGQHIIREYGVDPYELSRVSARHGWRRRRLAGRSGYSGGGRRAADRPSSYLSGRRCIRASHRIGIPSRCAALEDRGRA